MSLFTVSWLHVWHVGAALSKLVPVQVKVADPSMEKPCLQCTVMTCPVVAGWVAPVISALSTNISGHWGGVQVGVAALNVVPWQRSSDAPLIT